MKVVAINGSPNENKGNTELILLPFLNGMKESGANVEVFYSNKLKVNPCQGDLYCWIKNPGTCFQDDDMKELYPKMVEADILVIATPLYWDGMTGQLKNIIDRMTPMGKPFLTLENGHSCHPPRKRIENTKLVLVSNCGYWEMDNFNPLIEHIKRLSDNMHRQFSGALLRPHGPAMNILREQGVDINFIFNAAFRAGQELIGKGTIEENVLAEISKNLLTQEQYINFFKEPN